MEGKADIPGSLTDVRFGIMVSKKAHQLGISSEAALILLAKQHGIGTSVYQRKLDATKGVARPEGVPFVRYADRGNRELSQRGPVLPVVA